MDGKGSVIAPKSEAGRRSVPIVGVLRDLLVEWRMECGWSDEPDAYVFGVRRFDPFDESAARRRRLTAWKLANAEEAKWAEEEGRDLELVEPIGLHEARHVCASIMIAAGVNVKALSTYLGHSSITITLDRYGHLMPGNEAEATSLIDDYLARAAGGTLAPSESPQERPSLSKTAQPEP
jgi:integrase